MWSVADCHRNRFQLGYLKGEDVYAWFDREVVKHDYTRPLKEHQKDLADHFLTYHYGIMAAEMGVGKTLAAQEVMERSGIKYWWWIGPKTSLANIKREFKLWNLDPTIQRRDDELRGGRQLLKEGEKSHSGPARHGCRRDQPAERGDCAADARCSNLADRIREKYGFEGYVIEMSGTPSPKSPVDWWALPRSPGPASSRKVRPRRWKTVSPL